MSSAQARWGDQIAVEVVNGVPYRMYTERPRRVEDLLAFADRWGTRPHIIQGDRVVTFDDMHKAVLAKVAELQDLGVKRGDRVFILGWNSPEWVVNFWACLCAGAVPVLANTWWSAAEVAKGLAALEPALTLADAPCCREDAGGIALRPLGDRPRAPAGQPMRRGDGTQRRGRDRPHHLHLGHVGRAEGRRPVASRRAGPPADDAARHAQASAPGGRIGARRHPAHGTAVSRRARCRPCCAP